MLARIFPTPWFRGAVMLTNDGRVVPYHRQEKSPGRAIATDAAPEVSRADPNEIREELHDAVDRYVDDAGEGISPDDRARLHQLLDEFYDSALIDESPDEARARRDRWRKLAAISEKMNSKLAAVRGKNEGDDYQPWPDARAHDSGAQLYRTLEQAYASRLGADWAGK
jgi:hypothetical protein